MTDLTFGRYRVELTHADKLLFPKDGITKADLLAYYRDVSQTMLPHLRQRPLMMHRFPDGIDTDGFYQKEIGDYFPEWIERVRVEKQGGSVTHVVCNNVATLAYLVNQGCITTHHWLSRVDAIGQPDQLIFDLDPPGQDFEPVRLAALQFKELFDELNLPSYVKTTGSRGLHVVVPIDVSHSFDESRAFARDVAGLLSARHPDRLTTEQRKDKRAGRLFLDTGRNAYAQTAVAPYSVRALDGAPIATPLDWHELANQQLQANTYTISNILRRLGQKQDPWQDMRRHSIGLDTAQQRLEQLFSD